MQKTQCWIRSNRGTVDMIFVLMQIQKTCREEYTSLYAAFIDLTKAFDTVSRDGLWKILATFGCPPKSVTILCKLFEGQLVS